jgi:hypothetical protein
VQYNIITKRCEKSNGYLAVLIEDATKRAATAGVFLKGQFTRLGQSKIAEAPVSKLSVPGKDRKLCVEKFTC